MSDLISKKALLKDLSNWWLSETPNNEVTVINGEVQKNETMRAIEEVGKLVEGQPVAYDFDSVVQQICDCEECHCENKCTDRLKDCPEYARVYEIVKAGGIDEKI